MAKKLREVPAAGEVKELVPYGNHARCAKFIDNTDMIDDSLTKTMDAVCKQIDGFHYGRLDVRFNSWEELKRGQQFSIIELNGAGSEPTHIYDPKHSLFFAWKEIIRHWIILWKISGVFEIHSSQLPHDVIMTCPCLNENCFLDTIAEGSTCRSPILIPSGTHRYRWMDWQRKKRIMTWPAMPARTI